MHRFFHSIMAGGGYFVSFPLARIADWGILGTGVFLFLSGFGLFLSMNHTFPFTFEWLFKHLKKLWYPFIFVWLIDLFLFACVDQQKLSMQLFLQFVTLAVPYNETWFFRVIVGLYIISFLTFKCLKDNSYRIMTISLILLLYLIVMNLLEFGPWWYVSILNFPLGLLVANYYKKINELSHPTFLLFLFFFYTIFYIVGIMILYSLLFSTLLVYVVRFINIRSQLLTFVGVDSLCFYFFESPAMRYICKPFQYDFWLFSVLSLAATAILTLLFKKINTFPLMGH